MKNYITLSLFLVFTLTFSACSQQQNTNEDIKNQPQASENLSLIKTYKSNLYGFQFNYPDNISLETLGMEKFSDGNEVFGVYFSDPFSYNNPGGMQLFFDILTPNKKLAELAPESSLTSEEISQELKNPTSQKVYSKEEIYKYADARYQVDKKNKNYKISDGIDEVSIAGKKAYQYRTTDITTKGDPSTLYIFVSDGNTVYNITLTDSPLMQKVLSSIKFKD